MFKQVLDISLGRKSADKPVASKQESKKTPILKSFVGNPDNNSMHKKAWILKSFVGNPRR
jgi:hypothetical protein